jgi:hypothetical protein
MSLLASDNIDKVWYGGDLLEPLDFNLMTIERVLEISKHYMLNGNRPYYARGA